ncbi:hypothetical protein EV360DRAFT_79597 [Lentinula raphanica]|nr:hypothetical protein EV360DRAFT_79597 [Lentinula raphanica]
MTEFALPQTSGDPQAPDQNPAGSTTQNSPDPLVSKTPPHPFPQSKSLNALNRTHCTRADPEKYARLKQMSVEARLEYNLGVQRHNDARYAKSLGNKETSDSESIVSVDEREFQQIRRSRDSFNAVKAKLSQYSISWLMDRNLHQEKCFRPMTLNDTPQFLCTLRLLKVPNAPQRSSKIPKDPQRHLKEPRESRQSKGIPNWTLEDGLPALPRRPRSPSDDDSVALNAKRSKPLDVDFEPVEEMLSDDEGDPSGIRFPSELKLHARNKIPIPFHFFTTKNVKFLLSSHMTFDRVKLPNGSQAFSLKDAQKQIARSTDTDVKDAESLPWHLWEEAFLNLMFFHSSCFEAGSNAPLILELKGLADFFRNKEDSHKYYPYCQWKEEEDPGREEG